MKDPTRRFSDRVENYVKYRPSYPPGVITLLQTRCDLSEHSVAADIGTGTGIFAKLLLQTGCRVFGVEPNLEMRQAAAALLAQYDGFTIVDGTAEYTTLPHRSMDFITAAQAFHWFVPEGAKREFKRIGRPGAWIVLLWNTRLTDATLFLSDYESLLLRYSKDYSTVDHRNVTSAALAGFFSPRAFESAEFDNRQQFDYEALAGRLLSSSYAPNAGEENYDAMMRELEEIFELHQQNGTVEFLYKTEVHFGRLGGL